MQEQLLLKKKRVSVNLLVQTAVEPLLIPMDIKMQSLHVKGDEQAAFIGDFNWTAEALINILKNCVEHTPEGGEISILFQRMPYSQKSPFLTTGKEFQRRISLIFSNGFTKEKMPVTIV